jgi:hypothetical protein
VFLGEGHAAAAFECEQRHALLDGPFGPHNHLVVVALGVNLQYLHLLDLKVRVRVRVTTAPGPSPSPSPSPCCGLSPLLQKRVYCGHLYLLRVGSGRRAPQLPAFEASVLTLALLGEASRAQGVADGVVVELPDTATPHVLTGSVE